LEEDRVARKKDEYKTGNYVSGASLGFEQKLWAADEMRSYTDLAEHKYVVLGLDLEGLRYEA
jgi:hypothetical protein